MAILGQGRWYARRLTSKRNRGGSLSGICKVKELMLLINSSKCFPYASMIVKLFDRAINFVNSRLSEVWRNTEIFVINQTSTCLCRTSSSPETRSITLYNYPHKLDQKCWQQKPLFIKTCWLPTLLVRVYHLMEILNGWNVSQNQSLW